MFIRIKELGLFYSKMVIKWKLNLLHKDVVEKLKSVARAERRSAQTASLSTDGVTKAPQR